jgi:intergrase/recombinase
MILEHFRYRDFFIRKTKKAYISLMTPEILDIASRCSTKGENAFRLTVKRRGLHDGLKLCRKIFATYLRMQGITPEVIDLLQGRIPKTVFARHYLRPDMDVELEKVRNCLAKLLASLV